MHRAVDVVAKLGDERLLRRGYRTAHCEAAQRRPLVRGLYDALHGGVEERLVHSQARGKCHLAF